MMAQRLASRQLQTAAVRTGSWLNSNRRRILSLRQAARGDLCSVQDFSQLVSWLESEKGVSYADFTLETDTDTSSVEYRLQQSVEKQQVQTTLSLSTP